MEVDQRRLFDGSGGFELATDIERCNCLENGNRQTPFAPLREMMDTNLIVWELEFVVLISLNNLELSQTRLSVIDNNWFEP